jgi:ABC-2 type transport system permease protein
MGGYLTWRQFGSIAIVYAVWGMLAATGAGRGDEERGLTEAWLAAGVSRIRWVVARATAFLSTAILSLAVTLGLTALGAALSNDPLPLGAVGIEGLPLLGLTLAGYGLGLFVAQLVPTRRAASVIAGAALVGLFVLNSALGGGAAPGPLKWLSPFYLFDRSAPLLAGGSVDGPATIALFAAAVVLVGAAGWAFAGRDIGGALLRGLARHGRRTQRPSADPLLRLPVLAGLDQQRGWIAGWAIGLAVLGYFFTSFARSIIDSLSEIPTMRLYLERAGIAAYADIVGVIWFSSALLLLSAFVVVQVNGWAADDAEGRLETILAAGTSRTRVVLERIAALLVAATIVALVSSGGVYVATRVYDITVPGGRLLLATLLVLPFVFALGAVGHALVGWRPRLAVTLIATVAVVSYFIQEFAPIFDLPEWVSKLSLFVLYGQPMTRIDWRGAATLTVVGAVGTLVAIDAMHRRDVGR